MGEGLDDLHPRCTGQSAPPTCRSPTLPPAQCGLSTHLAEDLKNTVSSSSCLNSLEPLGSFREIACLTGEATLTNLKLSQENSPKAWNGRHWVSFRGMWPHGPDYLPLWGGPLTDAPVDEAILQLFRAERTRRKDSDSLRHNQFLPSRQGFLKQHIASPGRTLSSR